MTDTQASGAFVPVRPGLLAEDADRGIAVLGSRCSECGETTLGTSDVCPNCGNGDLVVLPLSDRGTVWTYTVIRYPPPGNYKGPQPFAPYAIGLVELPEGLRVLAPILGDPEKVRIGMEVAFAPSQRDDGVTAFGYQPTDGNQA